MKSAPLSIDAPEASDCCEASGTQEAGRAGPGACPRCGGPGRVVGAATLHAMLEPEDAEALPEAEPRFCGTPSCPVLYYGGGGQTVHKDATRVRVGVKETADPIPLCYCFGFTLADVEREVAETNTCTIPARIRAEVRAGTCACETRNPSGTCCLGDVTRAVRATTARRRKEAP